MPTYEVIVDTVYRELWRVEAPDAEAAEATSLAEGTFLDTDLSGNADARPEIVAVREVRPDDPRHAALRAETRLTNTAEELLEVLIDLAHAADERFATDDPYRAILDQARATLARARGGCHAVPRSPPIKANSS